MARARPQSFRQSLVIALVFTAAWGAVNYLTGDHNVLAALLTLPFFFLIILATMRGTNWLTVKLTERFSAKPEPPPEPVAPSSERPEHAQRRRERRRQRTPRRGGRRE